jgi:hypothetical protein
MPYQLVKYRENFAAGIAVSWTAGLRFPAVANIVSSPPRPDGLCDPTTLLSNGQRGIFPPG